MKIALPPVPACLAILFAGCATGMKTSYERDAAYDFSAIGSYRWIDAPAEILQADDTFLSAEMREAIDGVLAARGWRPHPEPAVPDVLVAYYIQLSEHVEYAETAGRDDGRASAGFTYSVGERTWNYREHDPGLHAYRVETGNLVVTVSDARTGKPVWRGTLQARIDRSKPLEKQREEFGKAARKILAPLP